MRRSRFWAVRVVSLSLFLLAAASLQASQDYIGWLSLMADSPVTDLQQISVTNQTGSLLCSVDYAACDNLSFLDWTLTVNFALGAPAIFYVGSKRLEHHHSARHL